MHALHSGHSGGLFAGASSPFLLSLPFLLFLFSLSSPPLSVLFKKKKRFGEARARKAATRVVWTASRINLRAVGACEASLLRSEASKPVFWRCQNAKTNKIHCSSKTKKFLKDTVSVSKGTFYDMLDSSCQRGGIVPCTAEVWPTSSF